MKIGSELSQLDHEMEVLKLALNDVAKEVFEQWDNASLTQKNYMNNLVIPRTMDPGSFTDRLRLMNEYLEYFPFDDEQREGPESMFTEAELMNILHQVRKTHWIQKMAENNVSVHSLSTLNQAKTFYRKYNAADGVAT